MPLNIKPNHKNHIVTQIITVIVFILLALMLVLLGRSIKKEIQQEKVADTEITTPVIVDKTLIKEVSLTTESIYGTVIGSYPEFLNAESFFNDKIRNAVAIAQAEFENNSKENYIARNETDPNFKTQTDNKIEPKTETGFMFNTDIKYFQVNENTISILINISAFSGGAHGYEIPLSFNYDVKNKKEINLSDVFPNDVNYLQNISTYSKNDLINQFQNKTKRADYDNDESYNASLNSLKNMIEIGTMPTLENFSVFTILPDTLNIHFSEYQVAPYVYGSQTVKMPIN